MHVGRWADNICARTSAAAYVSEYRDKRPQDGHRAHRSTRRQELQSTRARRRPQCGHGGGSHGRDVKGGRSDCCNLCIPGETARASSQSAKKKPFQVSGHSKGAERREWQL